MRILVLSNKAGHSIRTAIDVMSLGMLDLDRLDDIEHGRIGQTSDFHRAGTEATAAYKAM